MARKKVRHFRRKMAGIAALALVMALAAFASAAPMERPSGYVAAWLFESAERPPAELPAQPLAATGSATAREAPASALVVLAGLVAVAGLAGYAFAHSQRR